MATMATAAAAEVSLEFMTGNPQLGLLSGRLAYYLNIDTDADSTTRASATNSLQQNRDYRSHQLNINDDDNPTNPFNASAGKELPERRSTLLCILSVPAHMIPTDMLQFVAPMMKHVHSVRIVRPCNPTGPTDPERTPAEYMVLLQMESQDSADDLFLQCNGRRFNSFEDARCRVVFVSTATFDLRHPSAGGGALVATFDGSCSPSPKMTSSQAFASSEAPTAPTTAVAGASSMRLAAMTRPSHGGGGSGGGGGGGGGGAMADVGVGVVPAAAGLKPGENATSAAAVAAAAATAAAAVAWEHDAAACVICMDRMESRVLTTVCNHSFHVECLMKWQDSPCPVCRFHHNNASEASTCQECQATDNLWVCLICGSVLCGSRHEDHVRWHYTTTLHAYALEIETQQVWDFAGDGFVHRLIHNKADGKLVEIPDPGQTSEERPQVPANLSDVQITNGGSFADGSGGTMKADCCMHYGQKEEERLVHGKLEGLAYQFNTLLTSQLDEQRHFYQKQLNELLQQQESDRRERREKMVSGADLIGALRQERRELESKCASAADRLKKVKEETTFLWELNKSLEANKEQWSASLEQAQQDLQEAKDAREQGVPQLEAKVAQLMLKLDAAASTGFNSGATNDGSTPAAATGMTESCGTGSGGGVRTGGVAGADSGNSVSKNDCNENENSNNNSSSSLESTGACSSAPVDGSGERREGGVALNAAAPAAKNDGAETSAIRGRGVDGGEVGGGVKLGETMVDDGGDMMGRGAEEGAGLGAGANGAEEREQGKPTRTGLSRVQQRQCGGSGGSGGGKKKGRRKKGK